MKCRYCNVVLAPLRSLTDGEFCSDEHRQTFYEQQDANARAEVTATAASIEPAEPAALPPMKELLPLNFASKPADPPQRVREQFAAEPEFPRVPVLPGGPAEPLGDAAYPEAPSRVFSDQAEAPHHLSRDAALSWRWLREAWKNAPSDLKIITLLLPILLAVAVGPSVPKISIARVTPGGVQQLINNRWKSLHQTILDRAAVEIGRASCRERG